VGTLAHWQDYDAGEEIVKEGEMDGFLMMAAWRCWSGARS